MTINRTQTNPSFVEFVALTALMISLVALSTDAMLPALPEIGQDLGVQRENDSQLIVSVLFFGLAAGQLVFGPLSDSLGRKPTIYAGSAMFMVGCVVAILAPSLGVMLVGRALQGLGAAGPRSVIVAIVRDLYEGRAMARVMSFAMTVFILVPVIAPSFGQGVLLVAHWRAIFGIFLGLALIAVVWFALRQPETLPPSKRIPFSPQRILAAFREVLTNRIALGYTIASGLVSGAFLGYLNSAQPIFQDQYGLGLRFSIYFGLLASSMGAASFSNARLVMRYGMRRLSTWAIATISILSIAFFAIAYASSGQPPLWVTTAYMVPAFFCVGVLFGNLNALAMEPLGHIAGVGAAVIGSVSLLLGVPLGMVIGRVYNGTVLPLVAGFAILSVAAAAVMWWAENGTGKVAEEMAQP